MVECPKSFDKCIIFQLLKSKLSNFVSKILSARFFVDYKFKLWSKNFKVQSVEVIEKSKYKR